MYGSVLTLYELEYSFANCSDPTTQTAIRQTIKFLHEDLDGLLTIQEQGAPLYGNLKAQLKQTAKLSRKVLQRHNIDLMLASTAIAESCVLVSGDQIHARLQPLHPTFRWECWW